MNQEDIKYLLEPFSQEEQGYTRKYQGAGLGLAIASKLTKMMGGLFEIVSRKTNRYKSNFDISGCKNSFLKNLSKVQHRLSTNQCCIILAYWLLFTQ